MNNITFLFEILLLRTNQLFVLFELSYKADIQVNWRPYMSDNAKRLGEWNVHQRHQTADSNGGGTTFRCPTNDEGSATVVRLIGFQWPEKVYCTEQRWNDWLWRVIVERNVKRRFDVWRWGFQRIPFNCWKAVDNACYAQCTERGGRLKDHRETGMRKWMRKYVQWVSGLNVSFSVHNEA